MEKLQWNLSDYRSRLMNQFRNELGAHAGFSEKELSSLLGARFTALVRSACKEVRPGKRPREVP